MGSHVHTLSSSHRHGFRCGCTQLIRLSHLSPHRLITDYLSELAYPAELAGLSYSCYNTDCGFYLGVKGYSHTAPRLLAALLDKLAAFAVLPDRFGLVREELGRDLANLATMQPYAWAGYRRDLCLMARRWGVEVGAAYTRLSVAAPQGIVISLWLNDGMAW